MTSKSRDKKNAANEEICDINVESSSPVLSPIVWEGSWRRSLYMVNLLYTMLKNSWLKKPAPISGKV